MSFLKAKRHLFGFRAKGRDATEGCGSYQLREESARYKALLEAENDDIDTENTHLWDVKFEESRPYLGPTYLPLPLIPQGMNLVWSMEDFCQQ
jgi:hypothetical protein